MFFSVSLISARTSTPAITHCTVPTTSAPTPAPTNTSTTTPTVTTPPNTTSSSSAILSETPKSRRAPTGQSTRTSGTADTSATATAAAAAGSSSSNPIQLSDLQNFLQGIATAPPDQQSGKRDKRLEKVFFLTFH